MESGAMGKNYASGEYIVRQGEVGNCMYVIQDGEVEVVRANGDETVQLAVLKNGDFFGEMAIIEKEVRSADVRAKGNARVLTIDKRSFMTRVHQDPALAFRILQKLSARVRDLNDRLSAYTQAHRDEALHH
jgi:CRP/FNR family cyclic AMP-dependent transcriptional regulator